MRSIYIWLWLGPAAAPLIVRMCTRLRGVAIVCDYPHPALELCSHGVYKGNPKKELYKRLLEE